MNLDEIKQILEMMREHELAEFELERDDFKLRLRKNAGGQWTAQMPQMNFVTAAAPVQAAPAAAGAAGAAAGMKFTAGIGAVQCPAAFFRRRSLKSSRSSSNSASSCSRIISRICLISSRFI